MMYLGKAVFLPLYIIYLLKENSLKVKCGDTNVTVTNNKFTMNTEGTYTVTAEFVQPLKEAELFIVNDQASFDKFCSFGYKEDPPRTYIPDLKTMQWLALGLKRDDAYNTDDAANKITNGKLTANGAEAKYKTGSDNTQNPWPGSMGKYSALYVDHNTRNEDPQSDHLDLTGSSYHFVVTFEFKGAKYELSCDYTADGVDASKLVTVTFKNGSETVATFKGMPKVGETGTAEKFTTPAAPTKTGYTFGGWKAGDTTVNASTATDFPAAATTYTADWTPNTYTVNFDLDGGKVGDSASTITAITATYDQAISTEALSTPTKDGYTFGGWFLDDKEVTKDSKNLTDTANGTVTIKAKWTAVKYTIKYELDGGTAPATANPTEYTVDTDTLTLTNEPTKTGYTFAKWCTDAECNTEFTYAKGTTTGNLTLYAKWTPIQYTVYFGEESANVTETWTVEGQLVNNALVQNPAPLKLVKRESMQDPAGYKYDYDTMPWSYKNAEGEAVSLEKATEIALADLPTYAYKDGNTWKISLSPSPRIVATIAIPSVDKIKAVLTDNWAKSLDADKMHVDETLTPDESHETTLNASGTITAYKWEGFDPAHKDENRWYIVFTIDKPTGMTPVTGDPVVVRAGIDQEAPAYNIKLSQFTDDSNSKIYIAMLVGDVASDKQAKTVTIVVNWKGVTDGEEDEHYTIDLTGVTFAKAAVEGGGQGGTEPTDPVTTPTEGGATTPDEGGDETASVEEAPEVVEETPVEEAPVETPAPEEE